MWRAPLINDITTSPLNPPSFTNPSLNPYPPGNAEIQKEAYADLEPLKSKESATQLFRLAKEVALVMPRWTIEEANEKTFKIEGYATSAILRFKDDFVIEIREDSPESSSLHMRSKSRLGKGDLGANAKRIREYLGRIEQVLVLKEGE